MICNKEECYGCYACFNICSQNAIEMFEDTQGYIYPSIKKEKCISCNLCKKRCPALNLVENLKEPIKCYAAFSKDDKIHKASASGGLAFEFSREIIANKGVVYAVNSYLDDNKDVSFFRINNENELTKTPGSKYVHAYVKGIFRNVKEDLVNGKTVLFIGTPCQVAGLYNFLGKNYANLICVDLVCHGVPAQKMLKEEIKKDFDYVNFRGIDGFVLTAKKNNKLISKKNKYESEYFYAFLKGMDYRENCYKCTFAQTKRIGDITIGDFWGYTGIKHKDGISLMLINNQKGKKFIKSLNNLEIFDADLNEALKYNTQLREPTKRTDEASIFQSEYKQGNFKKVIHKIIGIKKMVYIKIKGKLKKTRDKVIKLWN